jgi:hypothetical protein
VDAHVGMFGGKKTVPSRPLSGEYGLPAAWTAMPKNTACGTLVVKD